MTLVVDASVALKWVLNEPGSQAAEALLDEPLIAPSLWLLEAANALWRLSKRGDLTADQAAERLAELQNAPITTVPIEQDLSAAAALAARLGHPVYDCLYLALAIREHIYVVTADRRFHAVASQSAVGKGVVRLLAE